MRRLFMFAGFAVVAWTGCGGGGGGSATPTVGTSSTPTASAAPSATASPTATATSLASVYKSAQWGSAVTVTFSGNCSMTLTTTGVPTYHTDYYLAPASGSQTVVATTPVSKTQLALIPYPSSGVASATQTFNVCPQKASTTTATSGGAIGYLITGEALFNPYESSQTTSALSDNASYTFTANGTSETAYFIDTCNNHSTNLAGTVIWHYHGVPSCVTSSLDGTGPSHLLGIALDGYPIYGGRDINGNVISVSQLDSCNGITSPTPEFPNGIYHYVLPIGVTSTQSSLGCYSGTVSAQIAAQASRYICGVAAPQRHAVQAEALVRRRKGGPVALRTSARRRHDS